MATTATVNPQTGTASFPWTFTRKGLTWTVAQLDYDRKTYIQPGEMGTTVAPYSEVCMHMQIAGLVVGVRFNQVQYPDWLCESVQLFDPAGREYSAPVSTGEAGLYHDEGGVYYYPPAE